VVGLLAALVAQDSSRNTGLAGSKRGAAWRSCSAAHSRLFTRAPQPLQEPAETVGLALAVEYELHTVLGPSLLAIVHVLVQPIPKIIPHHEAKHVGVVIWNSACIVGESRVPLRAEKIAVQR
jgi:hypothetical protein